MNSFTAGETTLPCAPFALPNHLMDCLNQQVRGYCIVSISSRRFMLARTSAALGGDIRALNEA